SAAGPAAGAGPSARPPEARPGRRPAPGRGAGEATFRAGASSSWAHDGRGQGEGPPRSVGAQRGAPPLADRRARATIPGAPHLPPVVTAGLIVSLVSLVLVAHAGLATGRRLPSSPPIPQSPQH